MKKYIIYLIICVLSLFSRVEAQKYSNNNFYTVNPYSYNPSYSGLSEDLFILAQFSGQNLGLASSPRTSSLFIRKAFNRVGGVGLRASLDQRGVFSRANIMVDGSYLSVFNPSTQNQLRIGVSVGLFTERVNIEDAQNNGFVNMDDPMFYSDNVSITDIQFGAGLVYQAGGFELGVASRSLASIYRTQDQRIPFLQTLFFSTSYSFHFADMSFSPLLMLQNLHQGLMLADIGLYISFRDKLWFQPVYRTNSSFIAAAGVDVGTLGIGYSTEIPFSTYGNLAGVAHSVVIHFTVKKKKRSRPRRGHKRSPVDNKGEDEGKE